MHKFSIKPTIYYSENAIDILNKKNPKKVFIIIENNLKDMGYSDSVVNLFNKNDTEIRFFSNIQTDPTIELVIFGVEDILSFNPDLVVAIGGGSTIDEAKAIVFFYNKISAKKVNFAIIPTTSGTGSEVTNFAIITIDGKKEVLVDDGFLPNIAILSVEFTKNLPLPILVDTSIDALTHAIEAYFSLNESDCSDALSEKAIKLIFKNLTDIFVTGDNLLAREKLHNASCIAGMAFTNASLGINHSMAHALGGIFHIPHGKANAVFLTKVIEFNSNEKYVREKIVNLCKELHLSCDNDDKTIKNFLYYIENLLLLCNMPTYVKDLNIPLDDYLKNIFELSDRAIIDKCTKTNPVSCTKEDLTKLFMISYEKIT